MSESSEYLHNSEKVNPELTRGFIHDAQERAEKGTYRVEVIVGDKKVLIDVFPEVFPPKSDYSQSSRSVYETFGNLEGLSVADIGSGSGVESIVARMAGAANVDSVDLNEVAVECTKHNIALNKVENVNVYEGSLLEPLGDKKYNLIIANLPIVNFKPEKESGITMALYDDGFKIHRELFEQAKSHLAEEGVLTFTHANLQSANTKNPNSDFEIIEKLVDEYGYVIKEKKMSEGLGYTWINYKITLPVKV